MSLTVKIDAGNGCFERTSVEIDENLGRLETLQRFAKEYACDETAFLTFTDEDGDQIKINDESILSEAIKDNVLRTKIVCSSGPVLSSPRSADGNVQQMIGPVTPLLSTPQAGRVQQAQDVRRTPLLNSSSSNANQTLRMPRLNLTPTQPEKQLPAIHLPYNHQKNVHHNGQPFLLQIKRPVPNFETKACAKCGRVFKPNSQGVDGYFFAHRENYRYQDEETGVWKTTRQHEKNLKARWTCVDYDCLTSRYDYIGRDLCRIQHFVIQQLSPEQKERIISLGFDLNNLQG